MRQIYVNKILKKFIFWPLIESFSYSNESLNFLNFRITNAHYSIHHFDFISVYIKSNILATKQKSNFPFLYGH